MVPIISAIVSLGTEWFKRKGEKTQAKHELSLKRIQSEHDIVLSIPMIGSFVPWFVPHMQEGFLVLGNMPDYYKAFLGSAIAASFGIKALSKWK